jgi:g-D-glutamyl-meso-diaminopimelate peptidase
MRKKLTPVLLAFALLLIFNPVISKAQTPPDLVNTHVTYTYPLMTKNIQQLKARYPDLVQVQSIGKTYFGRDIWAVKIGHGNTNVLINGSHHAREWMTTVLTMKMMEEYLKTYINNSTINGYNARNILSETSIWFVPMVNPDGVTLEQSGVKAFPKKYQAGLIKMNRGSRNFSSWKANARGVDLNRQYPPNWSAPTGVNKPGPDGYKGTKPLQEKEVIALSNFTAKVKPKIALAYHTSGQIIYWNYHTQPQNTARDTAIAKKVSSYTGYRLMPKNSGNGRG